ncbi:hypothetical protein D4764_02G0003700 [Takifugu flavidus]|uniref:DDE Tnp4 domain-containing protein n=1 Tax=Takifugu flavidus TaxID=433684 RepID=A0A5C6NKZ8_9TELE|nr:hypothetical protein D4764_02G0003700 [Takifugu flavidus]
MMIMEVMRRGYSVISVGGPFDVRPHVLWEEPSFPRAECPAHSVVVGEWVRVAQPQKGLRLADTGPHSRTVLTNKFVLKSHLRTFYEDCGIHQFLLILDLCVGDRGYALAPWLLTPLTNPQTPQEILFNQMHARSRSTIERTIGMLKGRWMCLDTEPQPREDVRPEAMMGPDCRHAVHVRA